MSHSLPYDVVAGKYKVIGSSKVKMRQSENPSSYYVLSAFFWGGGHYPPKSGPIYRYVATNASFVQYEKGCSTNC